MGDCWGWGLIAVVLFAVLALAFGLMGMELYGDWKQVQNLDALISRLEAEEGFRPMPYRDSRGVLTIGYGTNLSNGISPTEGEVLLRSRLIRMRRNLSEVWAPYADQPPAVQAALLDMAYQLGVHGVLEFRDMLEALKQGDYEGAARAALDSAWDEETPRRVERIVEVFRAQNANKL